MPIGGVILSNGTDVAVVAQVCLVEFNVTPYYYSQHTVDGSETWL